MDDASELFKVFRQACIDVIKFPTENTIRELSSKLEKYNNAFESLSSNGNASKSSPFMDYISLPLLVIIKRSDKSCAVVEEAVKCLNVLLKVLPCTAVSTFLSIFTSCFMALAEKEDPSKVTSSSEELKQCLCQCVQQLVLCSNRSVLLELMQDQRFHVQLGHAIFLCLKLAQQETNRALRTDALQTVRVLGLEHLSHDASVADVCRRVFPDFLPGIASAAAKLAVGDEKQGHKFTKSALQTLAYFVCLVLDDRFVFSHLESPKTAKDNHKNGSNTLLMLQQKLGQAHINKDVQETKTEEKSTAEDYVVSGSWLSSTSGRVRQLVEGVLCQLTSHSLPAVRLQVAHTAGLMLASCCRSVEGLAVPCLEALAALAADTDDVVWRAAVAALHQPSTDTNGHIGCPSGGALSAELQMSLQSRLSQAVERLPDVARGSEWRRTLTVLRRVVGCMRLLGGEATRSFLSLPSQLESLLLALATTLTYDTADPDLLLRLNMPIDPLSCDNTVLPSEVGERRVYARQRCLVEECERLCHWLAHCMPIVPLTHTTASLLATDGQLAPELLFLLRHILAGYTSAVKTGAGSPFKKLSSSEEESFVNYLLHLLLTDDLLLAPLEFNCAASDKTQRSTNYNSSNNHSVDVIRKSKRKSASDSILNNLEHVYNKFQSPFNPCLQQSSGCLPRLDTEGTTALGAAGWLKRNVLVVCNSLQVVAATSAVLGKRFIAFYSRVMCPLMEKCGESNLLVAHTARLSLNSIGASCGCGGLRGLVEEAVPHFWYPLSMQLKRPQQHPRAPQILQVALLCSSVRLSLFLQQLLQELLQCLDSHETLAPRQLLVLLRLYLANNAHSQYSQSTDNQKEHSEPKLEYNNNEADKKDGVNLKNECSNMVKNDAISSNSKGLGLIAQALLNHHKRHVEATAAMIEEKDEGLKIMEEELDKYNEENETPGVTAFKKHVNEQSEKDPYDEETESKNIQRDDDPENAPDDVKLIVNILERCCFLLHTRDRDVALVLLDTIELGCIALKQWENNQLPVLHKVWKPLLLRMKDKDTIVTLRSLTVCCVMVTASGDFLRKRCLKELLPNVNQFLLSQNKVSLNKSARSGYFMSAAYLTQKRLLENLYPDLLHGLQLGSAEMSVAVRCCIGYLDTRQPAALVEASVAVLRRVADSSPTHVWLALAHLLGPMTLSPPAPALNTIRIRASDVDRSILPTAVPQMFKQLSKKVGIH